MLLYATHAKLWCNLYSMIQSGTNYNIATNIIIEQLIILSGHSL